MFVVYKYEFKILLKRFRDILKNVLKLRKKFGIKYLFSAENNHLNNLFDMIALNTWPMY